MTRAVSNAQSSTKARAESKFIYEKLSTGSAIGTSRRSSDEKSRPLRVGAGGAVRIVEENANVVVHVERLSLTEAADHAAQRGAPKSSWPPRNEPPFERALKSGYEFGK